jgi:hypothetical protein
MGRTTRLHRSIGRRWTILAAQRTRGPAIDLLKGFIERPQTSEAGMMRNFSHGHRRLIDQSLRTLDTRGPRRRRRRCAEMLSEQPRQLPGAHAQMPGQILDAPAVKRAVRDKPQAACHRRARPAPRGGTRRGLRSTSQTRPEAGLLGRCGARVVANIPAQWLPHGTDGSAVDPGRCDADEDHAVKGRIARITHVFALFKGQSGNVANAVHQRFLRPSTQAVFGVQMIRSVFRQRKPDERPISACKQSAREFHDAVHPP